MRRRDMLILPLALLLTPIGVKAVKATPPLTLYKDPACGCCAGHADYLRSHGFAVTIVEAANLGAIRQRYGVPEGLAGCHTIIAGDHVIEGHVPIEPIRRLLAERPDIIGIALPDMPAGSPGMSGEKTGPFTIYQIEAGSGITEPKIFAVQ